MALNAYTIYGAPLIQNKPSNDALNVQVLTNSDEPWLSHPAIPPKQAKTRFVPAQGEYDDNGILRSAGGAIDAASLKKTGRTEVGSWYTSLPRLHTDTTPQSREASASAVSKPSGTAIQSKLRQGGDWFKSTPKDLNTESIATSTLADMLRRDPPNITNPHKPPVYYGIGPSNKGYEMLSKSGWEEGQPLGPRAGVGSAGSSRRRQSPKQKSRGTPQLTGCAEKEREKWVLLDSAMPKLVVPRGGVATGDVEIINLTIPGEEDTEDSSEEGEDEDEDKSSTESEGTEHQQTASAANQSKAILTPIPVALKHDRKGLGLSTSKKLVTHSSLALRHHIQHGAVEQRYHVSEMRRLERGCLQRNFGRGKRAFARKAKEEQRKRDRLMEYMGS